MLRLQAGIPAEYNDASPTISSSGSRRPRKSLGDRLFVLGHHYQRDEVMRWADARGDSFGLSVLAQQRPEADYIVFCGVHFMAESADILTADHQQVVLPDLNAGCSMADMANIDEVEEAWDSIAEVTDIERVLPITYMNSSADLKAFVGAKGGGVHLEQCPGRYSSGPSTTPRAPNASQVLFFPDQHLRAQHRNGHGLRRQRHGRVEPEADLGGLERGRGVKRSRFLLWKGPLLGASAFPSAHIEAFRGRTSRRESS